MTHLEAALTAYEEYRHELPELFANPPNPAFEIVFDADLQRDNGAGVMYRDDYYVLLRDAVRRRDGSTCGYIRLIPARGHGGAAVLPLLGNNVVLIRHQRHATRASHWEIPRGFADPNESPEETARREIQEELDAKGIELSELGSIHPDTGASNVYTKLYLARITSVGRTEANEGIDEVRQVSPEQLNVMVRAGEITDSFTLAAILQARLSGLLDETIDGRDAGRGAGAAND
jgi:ADP-ribose pyrophosphatase